MIYKKKNRKKDRNGKSGFFIKKPKFEKPNRKIVTSQNWKTI